MGLSEQGVFEILTRELDKHGYDFFVHCQYESVLGEYETHNIVIADGIPDILGIGPDDSVIAIEVKGNRDLKKGIGQAASYRAGSNAAYLAADHTKLAQYSDLIHSSSIGSILVSPAGVTKWNQPNKIENKSSLPEVRAQLTARLRGVEHISKIASLNLAHPVNFLTPALFLEQSGYKKSIPRAEFDDRFRSNVHLEGNAVQSAIEGAAVLNLIDVGPKTVRLTDHGRLGIHVLKNADVGTTEESKRLIDDTSHSQTVFQVAPLVGVWLQDQYRKHPDFEALFTTLQSFESGESVPMTTIVKRFVRDHPNAFLRLFCTKNADSREYARELIIQGRHTELYEDLETFRQVIRQNLFQNFARQLQHIGVLSHETSSTTVKLEDYSPEQYPWVLHSTDRNARLFY